MLKVKEKKVYKYYYPSNRAMGKQLRGMKNFISHTLLKDKYSSRTVEAVMFGYRHNDEIEAAMKQLLDLGNANNY